MEDFNYDTDTSDKLSLSLDDNDNNNEYVIKANVCKILSKQLKLPEIHYNYMGEYVPPKQHGLSNSEVIIPQYYYDKKDLSKIIDIDYFKIIKDDIRNGRVLKKYQLEYIKNLPSECKDELIDIFNDCLILFNEVMDTLK
jgi:hypothetical protein